MSEYYLKIDTLPESCVKCFAFSHPRDGWCKAKPELQVEMHNTDIHPKCPIMGRAKIQRHNKKKG